MIYRLLILVLITIATSCDSKNKIPKNVLTKAKMQVVLWDVLQADAFAYNFVTKDSTKKPEAELAKLQKQIFAVHKVTKENFYESYNWYMAHPQIMLPILDSMSTKLTKEKYQNVWGKGATINKDSLTLK